MNKKEDEKYIKSVDKAIAIIETLTEHDSMSMQEITESVEMPKSTVHIHLKTLEKHGLVIQKAGEYRLGLTLLDYGFQVRQKIPLVKAARSELSELAMETEESVWLAMEEDGLCSYLDVQLGERAIHTRGRIGQRERMHCTAVGKAILAHLSEERVRDIVEQYGLPKLTENTITSIDKLFEELSDVREDGIAKSDSEQVEGVFAVGAPVLVREEVRGSVSVSGPENRLKRTDAKESIQNAVLATVNAISLKLRKGEEAR